METLLRSNRQLKKTFTEKVDEIDTLLAAENIERKPLKTRFAQLKAKWENLERNYASIEKLVSDTEGDEDSLILLDQQIEERELLRDEICRIECEIQELDEISIETPPPTGVNTTSVSSGSSIRKTAKLPPIQIKSFEGDPTKWRAFWGVFEANVHNDPDLSKVQKFSYLISYLKGEAAAELDGFEPTDDSYEPAVQHLLDLYGSDVLAIKTHMSKLYRIQDAKKATDTESLRRLYTEVNAHVRSLEALGRSIDSFGGFVVTILLPKLLDNLVREWIKDDTKDDTDLDEMLNFIKEELVLRAACQQSKMELPKPSIQEKRRPEETRQYRGTASALPASTVNAESFRDQARGSNENLPCMFCESNLHRTAKCNLSVKDRVASLKKRGRCFKCLKKGHMSSNCPENRKCSKCNGPHSNYICFSSGDKTLAPVKSTEPTPTPTTSAPAHASAESNDIVLKTATLRLFGPRGSCKVRCLLDAGSHRSYVTSEVAEILCLNPVSEERLKISGFGGTSVVRNLRKMSVGIGKSSADQSELILDCLETNRICDPIPISSMQLWKDQMTKEKFLLADDSPATAEGRIDLLIGTEHYYQVLTGRNLRLNGNLMAVESIFEWILHGVTSDANQVVNQEVLSLLCNSALKTEESPEDLIAKLFELDGINLHELSVENARSTFSYEEFKSTVRMIDKSYHVALPWKIQDPVLANNVEAARRLLYHLLRRLKRTPDIFKKYHEQIEEYIRQGFIKELGREEIENHCEFINYLPHHPVIRLDKISTKVRIVFNASFGKPSLNDLLESGENLIPSMAELLIRFRSYMYGITADIEKAYLQLRMQESDRDAARFLWIDNPLKEEPVIKHFRWNSVVFGITSSPFHLAATLKYHLETKGDMFPETTKLMMTDFFVDDLITGANEKQRADEIKQEAKKIASEGGFPLRRWTINDPDLQKKWSREENETEREDQVNFSDDVMKVLGLAWSRSGDYLTFGTQQLIDHCATVRHLSCLRTVLSISARVYDLLGLITPVTISIRIMMQSIWRLKLGWDEEIPVDLKKEFWLWVDQLPYLSTLKIPRWYRANLPGRPKMEELHIFCDASERAYGAVAYIRTENEEGEAVVSIVASRARVVPIKTVTLPRLELMGAHLATKLAHQVHSSLPTANLETYFWTDSQVALAWIQGDASRWKPYVANRVRDIQSSSTPSQWRFVAGKTNPADLCSRGVSASALADEESVWWRGPSCLTEPKIKWPDRQPLNKNLPDINIEMKKQMMLHAFCEDSEEKNQVVLVSNSRRVTFKLARESIFKIERFSLWQTVLRTTAYIQRGFEDVICKFLNLPVKTGYPLVVELNCARNYWIRQFQVAAFPDEWQRLKKGGVLKKTSKLLTLQPYLDEKDEIIKIRARTSLSESLKSSPDVPILPASLKERPDYEHFLSLLIRFSHQKIMHGGVRETLIHLRHSFWLLRGRQVVKGILRNCVTCNRVQRKPHDQPTAPLPPDRCSIRYPFEVTGVDFAGPIYIRGVKEKSWVCVFTCSVTRAVHFELVLFMSAPCFIMAVERFMSRRGKVRLFMSDNAKTFERASQDLVEQWNRIQEGLQRHFADEGVQWKFIVEGAPWWGGWWERLVSTIKRHLKKTCGNLQLYADELVTVLSRIEAVVNSRPITYTYDDEKELEPLCPGHFLAGRRFTTIPAGNPSHDKEISRPELLNRLKLREWMQAQFWTRWSTEYLQERALHFKRRIQEQKIRIGEVVLIKEDNVKRQAWRMGVIVELHSGIDGVVRAVKLRTSSAQRYIRRPVQRLCSLEIQEDASGAEYAVEGGDDGGGCSEMVPDESEELIEGEISSPSTMQDIEDVAGRQPLRPASGEDVVKDIVTRSGLGLWPGPKWAGFGQTGLLKTGFTSNGFHSVWVTSKTGLNRVLPG